MAKVLQFEQILENCAENVENKLPPKSKVKVKKMDLPKGRPKSGRIWKAEKQRFKTIIKTKGIQKSNAYKKQMKLKEDLLRVKTISRARKQERLEAKELKKERRRANLEREKRNALKSEVVQVLKNPAKIKKMNRKQLRSIEKRDVTKISSKK